MSTLLPLALAQHEVLQDQRAWPGSRHLRIGGYSKVHGPLKGEWLHEALHRMCVEQPSLRLCPDLAGQRLLSPDEARPTLMEQQFGPDSDPDARYREVWQGWLTEALEPLGTNDANDTNSAKGPPPWRAGWVRCGDTDSALLLMAHHSVMDGWGSAQFLSRWVWHYNQLAAGTSSEVVEDRSYLQHLQEDETYRQGEGMQRDAAFWASELPRLPPPLFSNRRAAPARQLPPALLQRLPLSREDYARWLLLAQQAHGTEFASFAAVLAWHFGCLAGHEEVLLGVPVLNRRSHAHRATLGMYVGVMPLRVQVVGAATPRELAARVSQALRQAMRHARYPASLLARQLGLARLGRDSAFDLLLSFERQDYRHRMGAGSQWAEVERTHQLFNGAARFPLSITVCDFGADHELELVFEASSSCFDGRGLALLARRVVALAKTFAEQPDAPLEALPLLPPAEREAVLEGLHRDLAHLERAPSFVERFAAQAALHPLSTALVWDGGSLRYGELAARVRRLAARLLAAGVRPAEPVPLLLPRGPDLVCAQLAVARAGASFVPLDPEAPDERLCTLLSLLTACGARRLLGEAAQSERLTRLHPDWMAADAEADAVAVSDAELPPWPDETAPAYALFTSGSTGTPKAVRVPHGALARRFAWLARVWDLGPADRSLQGTQAGFDPSLIELLLPLTLGASVALPPPGRLAPQRWAAFATRHGCSFSALVPTTLARLLDGIEALEPAERERLRLRVACCGGEVLPPPLAQRWLRSTRAALWNVYGPTEACIFATAWNCRDGDEALALPVGSPVDDTRLYVLDAQGQPLPFGTPGEIWLGGPTLALDYLGDPEATQERFRPDPFLPGDPQARIYRTGDRGWLDGDGRLQFLGRADRQLKIRGQRIEPGEVEAALLGLPLHPPVHEVHVQGHAPQPGEPAQLHAYLAPASVDLDALRQAARQRLPEALLPTGWTLLDALPRTATGKLDQQRLPAPGLAPSMPHRPPGTPLEAELLQLMGSVLQREDLGVDDDFFQSGGDSLAALDWLAAIEQRTGLHADLALLAQSPTVARLAQQLSLAETAAKGGWLEAPMALALSQHEAAPTLFLAASGHGDRLRFQQLAQALAPQVNVQMLQPPPGVPMGTLSELAAAYGQHIQAHHDKHQAAQGAAPVWLAGFSVGGVAALETARWLQANGTSVQRLVLIDSVFPRWLLRQPWLWRFLGWLTRSLYVQELSMNGRRLGAMFKDTGLVGQVLALHRYRVRPYAGAVWLLRTSGLARWQGLLFGPWRAPLQLHEEEVQGLHGSVFEPGRVAGLAQCLRRVLALPPAP
ncbi:MAG: amino acid adenylation domain-containing protein [Burkholderiales bacterium]|nr:amino acid adenylation domain-containing protein [Burkholderiales bacterium]